MSNINFFNAVRTGILGPTLDNSEVEGCENIIEAFSGRPVSWTAYALATAYHETAHTMQPIKELGGPKYLRRMYDINGDRSSLAKRYGNTMPGDGIRYAGRGYVQLTWKSNYEKAGRLLKLPLVENPDLAMRPDIAADIMELGMVQGWFTGKKCSDYLPTGAANVVQFRAARRIINGTDKANLIAGYAIRFQEALLA
jgi:putative chitinase